MHYLHIRLKASVEAEVEADIQSLQWNGEAVYPNYPEDYERSFGAHDRFVVTPPRQEVLTPGQYAEDGSEITAPVLGDWVSHLVLPASYDPSHLQTRVTE